MTVPYTRAPHQGEPPLVAPDSLHAALLIDFDNVTMGMRSNLSKELKTLLESDVIKVKVSVQRAYADWRRYPQYIVPLSEASVDLISLRPMAVIRKMRPTSAWRSTRLS